MNHQHQEERERGEREGIEGGKGGKGGKRGEGREGEEREENRIPEESAAQAGVQVATLLITSLYLFFFLFWQFRMWLQRIHVKEKEKKGEEEMRRSCEEER